MARREGRSEDYCSVTGKRKYTSPRVAKVGLRRRSSDSVGVYSCPHCHFYHLRNQHRYSDAGAKMDREARSMPKKKQKKQKRGKGKRKSRPECSSCLDTVKAVGQYLERSICMPCLGMLRRGTAGRHRLISALEEAARIRAAERQAKVRSGS